MDRGQRLGPAKYRQRSVVEYARYQRTRKLERTYSGVNRSHLSSREAPRPPPRQGSSTCDSEALTDFDP